LHASDNALNPTGAQIIAPLLSQSLALEELRLNNTGIGPSGGRTTGEALYQAVENGRQRGTPYRV
jgi:Ran GTPase-activating protein 1